MNFIGKRARGLLHIAEYPVESILAGHFRTKITLGGYTYYVNQHSLRYKTFAQSCVCCCCGIVGSRMFLDTPGLGCGRAHFNLYAVWNGRLVLMTKDHIVPRSKGGPDEVENMRTMCDTCNNHRGNLDVTLDELYQIVCEKECERLARNERSKRSLLADHLKKSWL